jgi:hypothetical protein
MYVFIYEELDNHDVTNDENIYNINLLIIDNLIKVLFYPFFCVEKRIIHSN